MAFSFFRIIAISQVAVAKRFTDQEALDFDRPRRSRVSQSRPSRPSRSRARQEGDYDSEFITMKSDHTLTSTLDNLYSLQIGGKGEALVPALVPPPDTAFNWKSKEKRRFLLQNNEYKWELDDTCSVGKMCERGPGKVMHAKGGWVSNAFGKQLIRVRDQSEKEIFIIRREKHVWNPFQLRDVFRIYAPLPTDAQYNHAEPLFTINRDIFGKGFLWSRMEYRVYEGRVKDNKPLYYGIAGYMIWSRMKVYRAEGKNWDGIYLQEKGKKRRLKNLMAAEIKKKSKSVVGDLLVGGADLIPDKFDIKVYAGEDSALMLTLAALWDMKIDEGQNSQSADALGALSDIR